MNRENQLRMIGNLSRLGVLRPLPGLLLGAVNDEICVNDGLLSGNGVTFFTAGAGFLRDVALDEKPIVLLPGSL